MLGSSPVAFLRLSRNALVGKLTRVDVLLDDTLVGCIQAGKQLEIPVAPGRHKLAVKSSLRADARELTAKAGEVQQWMIRLGMADLSLLPAGETRSSASLGRLGTMIAGLGAAIIVVGSILGKAARTGVSSPSGSAIQETPLVTTVCLILGGLICLTGGVLGILSIVRRQRRTRTSGDGG
jgi:hypothetical protein